MTNEVAFTFFGSCIGVGALLGGFVALFNSWRP